MADVQEEAAIRVVGPVNAAMLAVLQSSDHQPLLKRAFALYAAKNQFRVKETAGDKSVTGFDVSGTTLLDLGELLVLLKAFRIVPQCLSVEVVRQEFSRARYHEAVGERDKDVGQLNFRDFVEFLIRLISLSGHPAIYECDNDGDKAEALMVLFHAAVRQPRHDANLKQLAKALGIEVATADTDPAQEEQVYAAAVNADMLTVYQSADFQPMLKKSFVLYAAKNQFKAKAGAMDQNEGFDQSGVYVCMCVCVCVCVCVNVNVNVNVCECVSMRCR
jgi:hypothetical protein